MLELDGMELAGLESAGMELAGLELDAGLELKFARSEQLGSEFG